MKSQRHGISYTTLCPAEGCGSEGEWGRISFSWVFSLEAIFAAGIVTSPNHPLVYPLNLTKTERIKVENGKVVRLEFTHFNVYVCGFVGDCLCDHLKITDGDGTTLMDKSCGISSRDPSDPLYFMPPIITTRSNIVDIFFHTDDYLSSTGWSLSWTAVTPGFNPLY